MSMFFRCTLGFAALAFLANTASAGLQVNFSTSDTDANAGGDLNLVEGGTGTMFVWVSADPGQNITGFSFEVVSSNSDVVQATDHQFLTPDGSWVDTDPGVFNDSTATGNLVTGAQAFAIVPFAGTGLNTNGEFVPFSQLTLTGTAIGQSDLSFLLGGNGVSLSPEDNVAPVFNTGSVTVSAVPEPGSIAMLGLLGAGYTGRRLRNRKKKNA